MRELDLIEAALLIIFAVVVVAGVLDAALLPADAWRKARRSKRFWIALQLLAPYIGAVAYFAGVRRDVRFFTAPPAPEWKDTD